MTKELLEQIKADKLAEFKKQYPSVTSADLQTFILGMNAIADVFVK